MKKINKVFLILIIIEIISILLFGVLTTNKCASQCQTNSFLDPFGRASPKLCAQVCVDKPYPAFYLSVDLFIITLVIYLIVFLLNKFLERR